VGALDAGCVPKWTQGDGCKGGSVLYPCGASLSAQLTPCSLCLGSPYLLDCELQDTSGNWLTPQAPAYDSGTSPIVAWCQVPLCEGRRPAALLEIAEPVGDAHSAGELLARAAHLEAASVAAFLALARELDAHGAPRALVRRARRAAADEIRHARDVGALARARGAAPYEVRLGRTETRSLLAIAIENAREGCVRETWGAACAVAKSVRAAARDVRVVMERVAEDELGHAALAWDLAAWLESRLSADERVRVALERARAIEELEAQLEHDLPSPWQRELGLPSREQAWRMLAQMRDHVWSRAA
jgi:hypothetical protein